MWLNLFCVSVWTWRQWNQTIDLSTDYLATPAMCVFPCWGLNGFSSYYFLYSISSKNDLRISFRHLGFHTSVTQLCTMAIKTLLPSAGEQDSNIKCNVWLQRGTIYVYLLMFVILRWRHSNSNSIYLELLFYYATAICTTFENSTCYYVCT